MTRSIVKKSSTKVTAHKVEAPEDVIEETAEPTTEVEYDEKEGTAKFSLVPKLETLFTYPHVCRQLLNGNAQELWLYTT
jgi:hypothetical protein